MIKWNIRNDDRNNIIEIKYKNKENLEISIPLFENYSEYVDHLVTEYIKHIIKYFGINPLKHPELGEFKEELISILRNEHPYRKAN